MHFVVQNNLYNELGYDDIKTTLEKFQIPHTFVKVIPFSHELIPDIIIEDDVIVLGATTMSEIAKNKNWTPGSFINENFDVDKWMENVGDNLLNYDSVLSTFKDVDDRFNEFFIRPCLDTKSFSGQCFTYNEFDEWRYKVINLDETYSSLNADTMVSYCSLKHIYQEYRFFIIDKKIITGSQYKQGSRVIYNSNIDDDIIYYTQSIVNMWQPARAFVVDIAVLDNRLFKIIEYNNINSAGFYAADVQKIILNLNDMNFSY